MRASRGNQRPVGYQRWRNLLFVHWPMPLEALRPLVPRELEIDLFTGQAYVSLIPFLIDESRPIGVPPALATRLLETNLRTYVRAVLPYFPAVMSMRSEDSRTVYASRRRGAHDARLDVTWSVGEPMGTAVAGTRDHFLIERYNLYVARRAGLYRGRVRHRPYPLRRATLEHLSETVLSAAGLPAPAEPPLCHYSPAVDVDIFWLERVRRSASTLTRS